MNYIDFLKTKIEIARETGFIVSPDEINPICKPHQRDGVVWAIRGGRRALFEAFGLGKTIQELEYSRIVTEKRGGKALIVLPLGVKLEFENDAVKLLGMEKPEYVRTMAEVEAAAGSILLTNYERVRDGDIDPTYFTACVLDEASVLRGYGTKTYQTFLDKFKGVPFKLVCTATPSPNKYKELIHYAGFLEVMDTGQALAQPLTSKVLTPTGWRLMGDLTIGDQVIGRNGKPTKVIGVYPQGVKDIYQVTFSDGSSTRCTSEHLWLTRTQYQRNAATKFEQRNPGADSSRYWTTKETSEISDTLTCLSTGAKNHQIPLVEPVYFDSQPIELDPYLLGFLLGDGHLRSTSVNFTTADQWIVDHIEQIVTQYGLSVRKNPHTRRDGQPNYDYSISAGAIGYTGRGHESNKVLRGLRRYGLLGKRAWEKRIPEQYLINAPEVRIAVLQGLMDADGTISNAPKNRTTRLCTTSRGLAEDVVFIAQSLGGTANVYERQGRTPSGKQGRKQFVVTIRLPNGTTPFRLPRKAALVSERVKYTPKRYIVSVDPDGVEEAQCIAVADPEHLYVTDDFVITHNTRFFQRDSTKANNLTIYPHKEDEFWLWVSTWALFITKPSDLGYDDTGYDLPPLDIRHHELPVDHSEAGAERDGQMILLRDAAMGLKDAAREKRESIGARVARAVEIVRASLPAQVVVWCHLNDEQDAIERTLKAEGISVASVYGSLSHEEKEQRILDWKAHKYTVLLSKAEILGSGANLQQSHIEVFAGIDYSFNDTIQAVHRVYRFGQVNPCQVHFIYMESESEIMKTLLEKWRQHDYLVGKMIEIIKKYGLSGTSVIDKLARTIGVERVKLQGEHWTAVNNDCVLETAEMPDNSIDLIHTSIPFSNHYEYTPSYNDFGHNEDTERFFEQMDHLTPQLLRILKPGRVAAIHVKDRVLFGNATGTGMPTMEPFHAMCIDHYRRHGFQYFGMITVVTDVVRENNQTYRLGWSEQCKDGTKMGVGCPEYILLFRKLPSDTSRAYADDPVTKTKEEYTRAQWQIDAHGYWRSSGDRLLTKDELAATPVNKLQDAYRKYSRGNVYSYEEHVALAKKLDQDGKLPATFMVVAPGSWTDEVWDDINRMRTLNTTQSQRRQQMHVCPLQLDIVERIINRYSNPGDTVLDPFGGLMTVPMQAVKMGRNGYGIELNSDYFRDGVGYLKAVEAEVEMPTLFDFEDLA